MKKIVLLLLSIVPLLTSAQTKERRVYYLDCTYSMINPNKIWDLVRDNLKMAIENVNDETTELIIIPFWEKTSAHLKPYSQFATEKGKQELYNYIDKLDCPHKSYTYLKIPLSDFYDNRVNPNRITYMFFLTDGVDEGGGFEPLLNQWGNRYGNKDVYGFYVMLCDEAKQNPKIPAIIEKQEHLWKVETADININILRLETNKASFNIRDEKYIEIPLQGKTSGVKIDAQMAQNDYYHITKTEISGRNLRIYVEPNISYDQSNLPEATKTTINLKMSKQPDDYTFFVSDHISVDCKNKKEYTLKVGVK